MRISIVTVAYNSSRYIKDAIHAVLSQTYADIQYIIIDGGSTDGTIDIIRSFGNRISVIISEPDNGIYDAMNKGIKLADGDVIGILNSDDIYSDNNVIGRIAERFNENSCDGVYGDLSYIDGSDSNKVRRIWKAGNFKRASFLYGWMPPHPSFFVKREVYEKYGLFNTSLKSAADYEFMLRVIYKFQINISYLPRTLVLMRTGGVSNSSIKNRLRANREDALAWKLNGLKRYFFTTWLKPARKIIQFFFK